MNLNKFTEKAQEAVLASPQLASELNHAQVEPEHLLVTLVEQRDGVVPDRAAEAERRSRRRSAPRCASISAKQPKAYGGAEPGLSPRLRVVLDAAQAEAKAMQDEYVSTEHLLLGILVRARHARRPSILLKQHGVTRERVLEALTAIRGNQRVTDQNPENKYQALERYGRDLTELARKRQARSGDRPRRRSAPRHPGAVAPHEEQSRAHRRARRRQDRHRRRPRAAHRPRRRARGAEEQEDRRARHGRADRRREVPRRVRGAAQGRAQGDRRGRRPGRALHRRAAHGRRRRRGRRIARRVEHAQADAGARRAAHDRRDDARRVSQAHREGRGARAALPAGHGRRADASRTPSASCAACASATRSITA